MVRAVHAGGVVYGVHVDAPAAQRVLDTPPLGEAEVPALAHHAALELPAVHPHGVVGPVPDAGLGLLAGFHVRPDAAVEEQVDLRFEQSPYHLVRRVRLLLRADHLTYLWGEGNGLGRAREHAAAFGDEALVVVRPRGARQLEEPLSLFEARLRVGVGIEEDVEVVERAHELDVPAEKHTVAEHIAGHVPDAGHREVLVLDVHPELPEVPLHRLPRTHRRDPHLLVVVAVRAARGEGVAEPEAVVLRDAVGDIREGRRALVRRHDEIRVVLVVAHDVAGRHHAVACQVVRQVEHAADKGLVAADDLVLERLAASLSRRSLDDEAALRADGHDHGVLYHLGLHEAEDLCAEVLPAVGPPDAAPRYLASPEVHALHAGGVDEDLEPRAGQRQHDYVARVELEREVRLWLALRRALVVVRAHRRQGYVQEVPEDAVLVQAHDLVERLFYLPSQPLGLRLGARLPARVEAGFEELHEEAGDVRVREESVLHVVL